MAELLHPATPEELRRAMASAAAAHRPVSLSGNNTKHLMAGPPPGGALGISTAAMRRVIQYEPRDLTISVEAGVPFAELNQELARNNQMIPLEGPYSDKATVGGMIAANISGSRRRLYGTARDLVIGMQFATPEGQMVQSGGMVVKNVAGLDMARLMIGSFGTLAAIAVVNFKLIPRPAISRTVHYVFDEAGPAFGVRDALLKSQLTPIAIDVLNPLLAAQMNLRGWILAVQFGGNLGVVERSMTEAAKFGALRSLSIDEEKKFWTSVEAVTPRFLEKFPEGVVVRVSTTLTRCENLLSTIEGPGHAHAGNGVIRAWFTRADAASRWLESAIALGAKGVIEFATAKAREGLTLWPAPGGDFAIMERIKRMFDPEGLLNRGRLYGRL